jgi:hypothetical protein
MYMCARGIGFASFYNFTIAFRDRFDIVCFSFNFKDFSSNKLYWIDNVYKQIRSSNLNGTDIKLLTTSPHYMPWAWGLIVFGDWIYWTSFTNNTIYRVDKETGSTFEVVKTELSRPVGIKIYSQENQPTGILCVSVGRMGRGYIIHANGFTHR